MQAVTDNRTAARVPAEAVTLNIGLVQEMPSVALARGEIAKHDTVAAR